MGARCLHPYAAGKGSSNLPVTPKAGKWSQKSKKETPNYMHLHGYGLISFSVTNESRYHLCGIFVVG